MKDLKVLYRRNGKNTDIHLVNNTYNDRFLTLKVSIRNNKYSIGEYLCRAKKTTKITLVKFDKDIGHYFDFNKDKIFLDKHLNMWVEIFENDMLVDLIVFDPTLGDKYKGQKRKR